MSFTPLFRYAIFRFRYHYLPINNTDDGSIYYGVESYNIDAALRLRLCCYVIILLIADDIFHGITFRLSPAFPFTMKTSTRDVVTNEYGCYTTPL